MLKGCQHGAKMFPKIDAKSMEKLVPTNDGKNMKNPGFSDCENTRIYCKGHQKSRFAGFGGGADFVFEILSKGCLKSI